MPHRCSADSAVLQAGPVHPCTEAETSGPGDEAVDEEAIVAVAAGEIDHGDIDLSGDRLARDACIRAGGHDGDRGLADAHRLASRERRRYGGGYRVRIGRTGVRSSCRGRDATVAGADFRRHSWPVRRMRRPAFEPGCLPVVCRLAGSAGPMNQKALDHVSDVEGIDWLRGLDTAETDTRLSSISDPCALRAIVAHEWRNCRLVSTSA